MPGHLCAQVRGHRCSPGLRVPEGEGPRAWLWSKAARPTFNVLVGAQPVPSIECSRSKLGQTERGAVSRSSQVGRGLTISGPAAGGLSPTEAPPMPEPDVPGPQSWAGCPVLPDRRVWAGRSVLETLQDMLP